MIISQMKKIKQKIYESDFANMLLLVVLWLLLVWLITPSSGSSSSHYDPDTVEVYSGSPYAY